MRNKREKLIRSLCPYYQSGGHCHQPDNKEYFELMNMTSFCARPETCTIFVDYCIESILQNKK